MKLVKWLFPGLLIIIGLTSCKQETKEKKEVIRKVKLASVEQTSNFLTKEYSGIIEEAEEVNLAFRVAGPIKNILISEGDYVKKGQLIAEMDSRDYKTQLAVAQAQYEQALAEIDRVKELHKRNSIADVDFDKAISAEKLLKVQLEHATNQLNDTRLFAPFSGYIQKVNFEDDEMVNHGTPIATIINLNYFKVDVDIPASLYVLKDEFTSFHCQQSDISDSLFTMGLYAHNKKADNNQLYRLHFHMNPDQEGKLAPGMNVKVIIKYRNTHSHPNYIPLEAVFYENDQAYVWVYNSKKEIVNKRAIVTDGLYKDKGIRLVKGLTQGETVVSAGVSYLKENQKVAPLSPASETNIGGQL